MNLRKSNNNDYRKLLKLLFGVTCVCVLVAFLSGVNLPLPEGEEGIKKGEGMVTYCHIERLNRSGYRYYIYFSVNGDGRKYSANFNSKGVLEFLSKACQEKNRIRFEYAAKRTLFRPQITYFFTISSVQVL